MVNGMPRVAFLAIRDISAGEELLWDYGVNLKGFFELVEPEMASPMAASPMAVEPASPMVEQDPPKVESKVRRSRKSILLKNIRLRLPKFQWRKKGHSDCGGPTATMETPASSTPTSSSSSPDTLVRKRVRQDFSPSDDDANASSSSVSILAREIDR